MDEQAFRMAEGDDFNYIMKRMQPKFHVSSRYTIARECYKLFLDEKVKLEPLLKFNYARMCLTNNY